MTQSMVESTFFIQSYGLWVRSLFGCRREGVSINRSSRGRERRASTVGIGAVSLDSLRARANRRTASASSWVGTSTSTPNHAGVARCCQTRRVVALFPEAVTGHADHVSGNASHSRPGKAFSVDVDAGCRTSSAVVLDFSVGSVESPASRCQAPLRRPSEQRAATDVGGVGPTRSTFSLPPRDLPFPRRLGRHGWFLPERK